MPVGQTQFDTDLAAFIAADTDYIAAVDAFIALPAVVDLSHEDTEVAAALAAVQAAKTRIPPPPPPPPVPKTG